MLTFIQEDGHELIFEKLDDGLELKKFCRGEDKHIYLKIPEAVENMKVVGLGKLAFCLERYLAKVVIPEGVEYIDERAFEGCVNLKEVELPESLIAIGSKAFMDTSLTRISFPKNVIYVGNKVV